MFTAFSFKSVIGSAALILILGSAAYAQPAPAQGASDLVAPWRVSVEGEARDRVFMVQGAEEKPDGTVVLKGRYGFIDGNRGVVSGEVTRTPEGRKLTMTTTAASVIVATQAADGVFSGNITYKSGVVKPVRLTPSTESELAAAKTAIAIRAAATTTERAPSPISEAEIESAISKSLSSGSVSELQGQARAEVPKTADKQELSIFYHKRGMANRRLGNYKQARADLRLALDNNQPSALGSSGWGVRWRIQFDLGSSIEANSDWFAAIDYWKEVVREYQQTDLIIYHMLLLQLSNAYSVLGQFAESESALKEANDLLPKLRSLRAWPRWAATHLRQNAAANAAFLERQGRHAEAERGRRAAVDNAERYLADMNRGFGRDHQFTRGAIEGVATSKIDLARNLATQGKYGGAELYARTGLHIRLSIYEFNTTPISGALSTVGWTRLQQGDLAGAEKYRRYALAAIQGSDVPPHSTALAALRSNLAYVYLMQGRWGEALKMFEERNVGLRANAEQFKRHGSRAVGWAYALSKMGQSKQGEDMVRVLIAAQLKRPVQDEWQLAQRRGVLAMALAANGRTAQALTAYRESIQGLFSRDQGDDSEEEIGYSRAFWQRLILENYLELLAKLHVSGQAPPDIDVIEESFWIADVARDSRVQAAISATAARAQLPDKNLAEISRKEQDTLNRIAALDRVLTGLADVSMSERSTKVAAEMRTEIDRLRKERATLRADIRKRFPEYAELIDPKPAGIGDVRKVLGPGEALVSVYLGESESYVWTIAAGGKAAFRVVPIKRDEIQRDVGELRRAVDIGEGSVAQLRPFDLARAHKLYRAFFEPDEALWKDMQVLNVIPHGALGELPFALLVTAQSPQPAAGAQSAYADAPWLIRKVAIAQLPSASAFAALRRTPFAKALRQPFVGFGDPLFTTDAGANSTRAVVRNLTVQKVVDPADAQLSALANKKSAQQTGATLAIRTLSQAFGQLSALPDTADELREIAAALKADPSRDLFLNRQATERNVKLVNLDNRRVVAFATHGIAPGELTGLDQPALVLSNPALTGDSNNDGFLTMEEVLGLKLNADWVVLSACNTGSADGRASEAVSGLGRAFFYAGARSLLVSNWAVETTSAKLLTTELFKRQAENPQLTRAEALRQSMLDLMSKKSPAGFSYAHPAFWAPFSLVGDGGR